MELHSHTKMSDKDALVSVKTVKQKWGHPAVAITDHGIVQAFQKRKPGKELGVKLSMV